MGWCGLEGSRETPAPAKQLTNNVMKGMNMTTNRMKRLASLLLKWMMIATVCVLVLKLMAWADSDAITIRTFDNEHMR